MNGSKPGCPLAIVTLQGEDIRPARCNDLFPLTLTLSLGEREGALRCGKPRTLDCSPGGERFTLSSRERAGVRGKRREVRYPCGPIPELSNSSSPPAEPEVSQKDYECNRPW